MKIRNKLTSTILFAFILNIIFLACYYEFYLTDKNILKLEQEVPIKTLRDLSIIRNMIRAEIVILGIIIIMLAIIIHYRIVTPILNLHKDISEYKYGNKPKRSKKKDELGCLRNNFVDLTEDLEEEKKNQSRIIASISHDVKTPLTSIMGYAEMLKNKDLSKERREKYTDIIYSKSQDIRGLLNDFDDLLSYKLEKTMDKSIMSVSKLKDTLEDEYMDELSNMGIEFDIEINSDQDLINIDILKIRRVFGNIIGNSIKHMKKYEKIIFIKFEKVQDYIVISVLDNGEGVCKEELSKIFEALYTSDESRKVAGLGLSICKNIIKSHDGEIWGENNYLGGLTIKFNLPIYKS